MPDHSVLIAPSILSADFRKLQEEVASVEPFADWLQVDVMDGHFVANLSFGAPVVQWIETDLLLDIHLMVSNPADRIEEFLGLGAGNITFHAEAVSETSERLELINRIRDGGAMAGIALKPETSLESVVDVFSEINLLLVMSVEPGFGGQEFVRDVLSKVREARKRRPDLMIQMDGGIDDLSAAQCREAGANNLVAGSYIFRSEDRGKSISLLRGEG